jgi:hypothetical protein
MIEYLQASEETETESPTSDSGSGDPHLMCISPAALDSGLPSPRSMQLLVKIQGHSLLFLVDSGSSSCFIDGAKSRSLTGCQQLAKTISVQIAGCAILQSIKGFPALTWSTDGNSFTGAFRVLPLGAMMG